MEPVHVHEFFAFIYCCVSWNIIGAALLATAAVGNRKGGRKISTGIKSQQRVLLPVEIGIIKEGSMFSSQNRRVLS